MLLCIGGDKMKITNEEKQYNVELAESETLEIKINGVTVINETVNTGKKANITFMYQEVDV